MSPIERRSPAQDDPTRIAPPRMVPVPVPDRSRQRAHAGDRDEAPILESTDWMNSLRPQGREPGVASVETPLRRSSGPAAPRRGEEYEVQGAQARPIRPAGPGMLVRLKSLWGTVAPGREKILTSPLVIGLAISLVLLVVMGFWLRSVINANAATRTFDRAVQNFDDGDYRTAMRDFDSFLTANPTDSPGRQGQGAAHVRQRAAVRHSRRRHLVIGIEATNEMVEKVGQLPEFRDEQINVAELISKIGEGLADRARQGADAKSLAEAETAVPLHAKVAGEPGVAFLNALSAACEADRGASGRQEVAGSCAGARQHGPGHEGICGIAGLRCPRRAALAVCRFSSGQRSDRADDGCQRR